MRRIRVWAGAAAVVAAVVVYGCSESDPPKRPLAKKVEDDPRETPPAGTPKAAKPAATDPAAEAVIDKLLAAHTGGQPDRLAPLKSYKSVRKGRFDAMGPATWTVQAVWPDKFRQHTELPQLGPGLNVSVRNGPSGWNFLPSQGMAQPVPLTPTQYTSLRADTHGEWVALLVPLLDRAGRVAAPVGAVPIDGKPTTGVRVWVGDNQPVVLRVADATGHVARIEYEIADETGAVPIVITFLDRKETNGVLLPNKSAYVVNNRPISTWDTAEYEFPVTIPAVAFENP